MLAKKYGLVLLSMVVLSHAANVRGDCISLVKGPAVFDVEQCKPVVPKDDFNPNEDYSFYKGMTEPDRQRFLDRYRGAVVHGTVMKSDAIKAGLSKEKGALEGEKIKVLINSGVTDCTALESKRLSVKIDEQCCQGGVDAPCLLQTPFILSDVKVIGEAKSDAGNESRKRAQRSAEFIAAVKLYKDKKYKEAIQEFKKVRQKTGLDILGLYLFGVSYRKIDECYNAIPPLKEIFDREQKKEIWADDQKWVRKSNLLLARCYAKTNQAPKATIILNSYLIDPEKHRYEIKQSLNHPDFGWINATKEYREYRQKVPPKYAK